MTIRKINRFCILKVICLILSAIILSCVLQIGWQAGAVTDNFARNSGFESGNATEAENWGLWPGWDKGSFISTETVHTGNRAIAVNLKSAQNYALYAGNYRTSDFTLNAAMTVKMWVKYENLTGGFSFGLERKYNDQAIANSLSSYYTGSSDGWIEVSYNVPETTQTLSEDIIKVEIATGSGTLYIDDVTLCYTSQLPTDPTAPTDPPVDPPTDPDEPVSTDERILNASFEDGSPSEASAWGLSSGWNSSRFSADAYHGTRSVSITLAASDINLFQSSSWNPASYNLSGAKRITARLKYDGVTGGGVYLKVERKKNDIGIANVIGTANTGSSDGYAEAELIVPATASEIDELIVSVVCSAGSGTVLIDSISMKDYVKPVDPENPDKPDEPDIPEKPQAIPYLLNGSFEEGGSTEASGWGNTAGWGNEAFSANSYDGNRSVVMRAGATEQNLFQSNVWNPNAKYSLKSSKKITAWVKCDNLTGGGVYLRVERKKNDAAVAETAGTAVSGNDTDWQQISLIVPETDKDIDEFILSVICGAGSGAVYVDKVEMTNYIPSPGDPENPSQGTVTDTNLFMNGSFEHGTLSEVSGWGIGNGWKPEFITTAARTGGRAVAVTLGNTSVNLFQSSMWNPQKYNLSSSKRITVWINYQNITGTGIFLLAERKVNDKAVSNVSSVAVNGSSNGYTELELIVPATTEPIEEFVFSIVCAAGTGTAVIDDAVMSEYTGSTQGIIVDEGSNDTALLRNGGLEVLNSDGSIFCWDVWPGTPAEGERITSISTDIKHGGKQALCVSLTPKNVQAVYQYTLLTDERFDFQQAYVFSAWMYFDTIKPGNGETLRIGVKRKGTDGNYYNSYNNVDVASEGWQQVKIVVPRALVQISQYDVIIEIPSGTGNLYMDDFLLESATAEDLATLAGTTDTNTPASVKTTVLKTENAVPVSTRRSIAAFTWITGILAAVFVASASVTGIMLLKRQRNLSKKPY